MDRTIVPANTTEQNRFETITDFKTCMRWHGDVEFVWHNIVYIITHRDGFIFISHSRRQETGKKCTSSDDVLEYTVGTDRLRDVITQVIVLDRTV